MKNLWTWLVNTGIVGREKSRESRNIAFLNALVLLVLFLILQNILLAAFYNVPLQLIAIFAGHFFFIALTLVWNHRKHYLFGRVWFGLSAALYLTIYSIAMGPESYWDYFLVICVYVQFHIFSEGERPWMAFVVLICSLCFIGIHFQVPAQGILSDLSPAFVHAVTVFNLAGILIASICMGAVGYMVVNRNEHNLVLEKERSEQAFKKLKAMQTRLIQQEKMASLGALTAGIAHEIKNPLNFVNNFAEVSEELTHELSDALDEGDLEEVRAILADLRQNTQVIHQHGKKADGIVHAMMQHASGRTGQPEATDLNALVSEHIDLAYHGKRAQRPDFAVDIQRDLGLQVGPVEVVQQEIGRVLLNLLSNAFDAVQEHTATANSQYVPTVRVTTQRRDGQVEIRVCDNGPGIPVAVREKIFEPFFTTKPTGSGTGLGLSLSYDIVTQGHGGTLHLDSTGKETTFIITLPISTTAQSSA